MTPRNYRQASPAPADACTRVGGLWYERPMNCARMNPAWLRKQSKRGWTGACHEPRQHATYVWCMYPNEWMNWDLHWTGRKGSGPYRNGNACTPVRPLRMPHDPAVLQDPPEAWATWWRSVQALNGRVCLSDWWDVSPMSACMPLRP